MLEPKIMKSAGFQSEYLNKPRLVPSMSVESVEEVGKGIISVLPLNDDKSVEPDKENQEKDEEAFKSTKDQKVKRAKTMSNSRLKRSKIMMKHGNKTVELPPHKRRMSTFELQKI